ncbi:type II toxin-antitoxin system YafO family toxin [Serratia marcescens]|uniref:type II toxin-antitoxin system YafO family toxin n=1 Tax=Serratia liquefaciens TaxID=614 RepID=UPI00165CFE9B|nr:type II toxin-antitoxin system YafO family toxin [Serratia liquefaciens]MBH3164601.1 type II toxin-antitoxin system YafO family toxin [Serratia marcescens]QNQ56178.1 type II toxin-antitoxin system YafO family toxin [Serratia liquefaciens]
MLLSEYTGGVIPTGEFKTDQFLISLKEAFKSHWRDGHHPNLGKDSLFERPDEIRNYHLRKVHVNLKSYASYSFTSTEQCWSDWSFGKIDEQGNPRPEPTSNAYLIYTVNDKRDAVLLAYWDPPAHTKANEKAWINSIINFARIYHEKTGSAPMPRDIDLWHHLYKAKKPA